MKYLNIATQDLENIVFYISHNLNNPSAALRLKKEIIKGEKIILTFPHGILGYKKKNNYYIHKVKKYYIIYTVNEKNKIITIVRVLYSKRNISKILKGN